MGLFKQKTMHILLLFFILPYIGIWKGVSKRAGLIFLVVVLLIIFLIEYLRIEHNKTNKLFTTLFQPENSYTPTRFISFLAAAIISLAVFDLWIAVAAVFMATFGDTIASIIGKNYGKTILFRNKTLEGSIAGLLLNIGIGIAFLLKTHHLYVPLGMALLASLSELALDTMDDNLVTPLLAGLGGHVILQILY